MIYKFCDAIPGYNDLCKDDRELLFRSACLELFTLRLSHRLVVTAAVATNFPYKLYNIPQHTYYIKDFNFNLVFAHRTLPNSMKLTFCNGTVLHRNQVRSTFGDWLNGITELSKSLQAIDIDASAYACLSALTLVNGKL